MGRKIGGTMKRSQQLKIKMMTILIIRRIKIITKHVPDINKQSLIFPGEWPYHKNIHSVLNNVLLDNNIKSHTLYPKQVPCTPKLVELGSK